MVNLHIKDLTIYFCRMLLTINESERDIGLKMTNKTSCFQFIFALLNHAKRSSNIIYKIKTKNRQHESSTNSRWKQPKKMCIQQVRIQNPLWYGRQSYIFLCMIYEKHLGNQTKLLILMAQITIQAAQRIHYSGCIKTGWQFLVAQLGY